MRRPRPVVDHGDIITIAGPVDPAGNVYDFVLGLLRWMLEDLDDAGERRRLDALRATVHETSRGVIYNSAA